MFNRTSLGSVACAVALLATAQIAAGGAGVARENGRFDADLSLPSGGQQQEGETPTTCLVFDDQTYGAGGTIATTSDLSPQFTSADLFQFNSFGTVPQLQWVGYYRAFNNPGFSVCDEPLPPDNFTVRILGALNGLPDEDNVLFEITQAGNPELFASEVQGLMIGERVLMLYTLTFPEPFVIDTLEPMFLNVVNESLPVGPCRWFWRTAPPGDSQSWSDDLSDGTGWDDADLNDFDLAYCFTFLPGGEEIFPPRVTLDRVGPADVDTGCCQFRYNVRNRNAPGAGNDISEFYIEFNKGTGAAECEGIENITPPVGFQVETCEDWADGKVVYRFFGGDLQPQASTFGQIRIAVNGEEPVTVMIRNSESGEIEEQFIAANGVRAWASQSDGAGLCGNGEFGPGVGQQGDWSLGQDGLCALQPIPAMASVTRAALFGAIIVGGLLVLRSRSLAVVHAG